LEWEYLPYFLFFFLTWTTCQISLYSGGIATNLIPGLSTRKSILVLGLIMIILAFIGIINYFKNWLILLNRLFAPMLGIDLINYFFYQNKSEINKINWPAILSLFISLFTTPLLVETDFQP
jgi:purine-cytosine permease-like protein